MLVEYIVTIPSEKAKLAEDVMSEPAIQDRMFNLDDAVVEVLKDGDSYKTVVSLLHLANIIALGSYRVGKSVFATGLLGKMENCEKRRFTIREMIHVANLLSIDPSISGGVLGLLRDHSFHRVYTKDP